MSYETIEPLEPGTWLIELGRLTAGPADDTSLVTLLRRAFHLVQLAPRPLRHVIACRLPEAEFERLLDDGDLSAAAEALIGPGQRHSVSAAAAENRASGYGAPMCIAKVGFADGSVSCRAVAPSAALALFAAWCECLRALAAEVEPEPSQPAGSPGPAVRSRGQRRSRSARRLKLTEH